MTIMENKEGGLHLVEIKTWHKMNRLVHIELIRGSLRMDPVTLVLFVYLSTSYFVIEKARRMAVRSGNACVELSVSNLEGPENGFFGGIGGGYPGAYAL